MSITKTQHHGALRAWLVDWLAHYPEDIFAPPPEFTTERDKLLSTVVAAHMGRHVLRRIVESIDSGAYIDADGLPTRGRERLPSEGAEPAEVDSDASKGAAPPPQPEGPSPESGGTACPEHVCTCDTSPDAPGLDSGQPVAWVVNSIGELGVELPNGRVVFLYKGRCLDYGADETMLYRRVEKREFGECCKPRA